MLFQEVTNNDSFLTSCIIKSNTETSRIKLYGGIWYIFHLNKCDVYDDYLDLDSDEIEFTDEIGSPYNSISGYLDASFNELTFNISSKAILILADDKRNWQDSANNNLLVANNAKKQIDFVSGAPIYKCLDSGSVVNVVRLRNRYEVDRIASHIASTCNAKFILYPSHKFLKFDTQYNIKTGSSGIKSGQFIL